MNIYEKYIKKVSLSGGNTREYLLNTSKREYENLFETSPSYYQVKIDGELIGAIIHRTVNYDEKVIYFRKDYQTKIGSIVDYNDDHYLILEKDGDSINNFAKMGLCNGNFKVQINGTEKELVGYDERGRPYYDYIKEFRDVPCIIRDKYYSTNENAQLPLPEGKLDIILTYQEAENIRVNNEFEIQGKLYKIADVSYIKALQGEGIMTIHAERREGNL